VLDGLGQDAHDVGAAGVEGGDFGRLDVESGDAEALVAEEQGERQAHVTHADDADAGFAGFEFVFEGFDLQRRPGRGGDGHVFLILNPDAWAQFGMKLDIAFIEKRSYDIRHEEAISPVTYFAVLADK